MLIVVILDIMKTTVFVTNVIHNVKNVNYNKIIVRFVIKIKNLKIINVIPYVLRVIFTTPKPTQFKYVKNVAKIVKFAIPKNVKSVFKSIFK